MKDYLKTYGAKRVPKFNAGGMMPGAPAPAPAPQDADPLMMAQQAVETQDGALALEVCNLLLQSAAPADPNAQAAMGGDPMGGIPMGRNGMAIPHTKIPSFKKRS